MPQRRSPRGIRLLAAPIAALALLVLAVAPAAAGGVAIVVPAADGGRAVEAGTATTIEFTLLQHGVRPVDFGTATVVLTNTATGQTFRVRATPNGAAGGFRAAVTYPEGGWWAWHVEHDGLLIQSAPTVVGVMGGELGVPAYEPGAASSTGTSALVQQLSDANAQRDDLRATGTALAARLAEATARADEAEARPAVAVTAGVALVAASISLLAGLGLGWFARVRTATRPTPALGVPASEPLD
jgi:hypothetical protein